MATAVETMHDGWPALIRQQWRMQMLWGAFCCAPCGCSCLALSRMQAALTKVGGGGQACALFLAKGGQASALFLAKGVKPPLCELVAVPKVF